MTVIWFDFRSEKQSSHVNSHVVNLSSHGQRSPMRANQPPESSPFNMMWRKSLHLSVYVLVWSATNEYTVSVKKPLEPDIHKLCHSVAHTFTDTCIPTQTETFSVQYHSHIQICVHLMGHAGTWMGADITWHFQVSVNDSMAEQKD